MIDTAATVGGFDHEDLAPVKAIPIAWQLTDADDCWTDVMVASLCRQFFLAQYQDPTTGKERLSFFANKAGTTPSVTVNLSKIIRGSIQEVSQPESSAIYCEPVINYYYDPASGEYTKQIKITHASASAYDPSYVTGLTGTTAELAWTRCHILWLAYRQIEEVPSDMSDCPAIRHDVNAEWRLDTWLSWMGATNTDGTPSGVLFQPKKRIRFAVPYSVGADWYLTMHGLLQLPHQTDDAAVEFVITKLSRKFQEGEERIEVEVVLYEVTEDIAVYIQDTYTPGTDLADWQDSYLTKADAPSQGNDVQDAY